MNRARARRLIRSGNIILDEKGNIWNVLMVESNIKSKRCWYQLMQLRGPNGKRKFTRLIEGIPGRSPRIAKNKLIRTYYNDDFKLIKYDGLKNEVKKIIE